MKSNNDISTRVNCPIKKRLIRFAAAGSAALVLCSCGVDGWEPRDTLVPPAETTYGHVSDSSSGSGTIQDSGTAPETVSETTSETAPWPGGDDTVTPAPDTTPPEPVTSSEPPLDTVTGPVTTDNPHDTEDNPPDTPDTSGTDDTADTAISETPVNNPSFRVGIVCDREYSVSDGRSTERFSSENYAEYALGTIITLTAEDAAGFGYWRDGNNTILSESPEYSFIVSGDATVTAVFNTKATGKATVIFMSDYGQVMSRTQVSAKNAGSIQIPDVPRKYGYESVGWQYSAEQIAALVGQVLATADTADDVIVVRPVYSAENPAPGALPEELAVTEGPPHKYTFGASFAVPGGCRILTYGIIFTPDKAVGESGAMFNPDTAEQRTSSVVCTRAEYVWTVSTYETLYVRTYLVYADASGIVHEVLGSVRSSTAETVSSRTESALGRVGWSALFDGAAPLSVGGYEEKR